MEKVKNKRNLKEEGITLVALITTVIILLILAFVIIGMISGEGGLFGKFKQFLGIKTNAQNEQKYAIKQLEKTVNRFDIISDSNSNIRLISFEAEGLEKDIKVKVRIEGVATKIEYSIDNGVHWLNEESNPIATEYRFKEVEYGSYFVRVRITDEQGGKLEAISDILTLTHEVTAKVADVLEGKTYYSDDGYIYEGEMTKNEKEEIKLGAGEKYTIPQGYHGGAGTVVAKTLVEQTDGTAVAGDILSGKTAYVDGAKVTGTMTNNEKKEIKIGAGEKYTIPQGYHGGAGTVVAKTLAEQTDGTAVAGDILSGKTAYVDGSKVTGSMTNNEAKNIELEPGKEYTIPQGYHSGTGIVAAKSLSNITAQPEDVVKGKTYNDGTGTLQTGTLEVKGKLNRVVVPVANYYLRRSRYSCCSTFS